MSDKTELQIVGVAALVDGVTKYRLDCACLRKGALPDANIFVYQVTDVGDASKDVFIRIAYPADFSLYSVQRQDALSNADYYYRTAFVSRTYDSVDEAATARRFINDAVNKLVEDYIKYKEEVNKDEIVKFPWTTPDYITELKNTYLTYYAQYTTASGAYVASQASFTAAKTAYSSAVSAYSAWASVYTRTSSAKNTLSSFVSLVATRISEVQNLVPASGAKESIINALSGAQAADTTMTDIVSTLSAQTNSARAAAETAAANVSTARKDVYEKYADASSAWTAADAALKVIEDGGYDPAWAAARRAELGPAPTAPVFD